MDCPRSRPSRKSRDAFDLQPRAEREAAAAEGAARRQRAGREIAHIDLIERRPFRHVGEHDRELDDIVEAEAAMVERRANVVHRLPRFGRRSAAGEASACPADCRSRRREYSRSPTRTAEQNGSLSAWSCGVGEALHGFSIRV